MFDPDEMHKVYDSWPRIARDAYDSELEPANFTDIDHIVFAGMGGSGAVGDLFSAILSRTDVHVSLVKGYLLPKTVDERTLVVVTSVSGNTAEALAVLEYAHSLDCKLIAFSSGGRVESFCTMYSVPFRRIAETHSPRTSFPTFVYSMLKVLGSVLPIEKDDILESIRQLEIIAGNISSSNLRDDNVSLHLAQFLSGIPCVYYPHGLHSAATRFKNSLQENAKMHVLTDDIIEACHNGIVAWERPSDVRPILIRGTDDYFKTVERWEILKRYFEEHDIEYFEVTSIRGNILSKLICMIYLLDLASIYRAVLSQVDPTPVKSIDFVKENIID